MFGRDVVSVSRKTSQVRCSSLNKLSPRVRQIWRDLNPNIGHEATALGDQSLDVFD
jgi:hypothetical protein